MATPQPTHSRGHSRNTSDARRIPLPRRNTKGPLDLDTDDFPSAPPTPTERTNEPSIPAIQTTLPASPGPDMNTTASTLLSPTKDTHSTANFTAATTTTTTTTNDPRTRSPSPAAARPQLDLSPLLRQPLYSAIPTSAIPQPFLSAPAAAAHPPAPTLDTLDTLLTQGRIFPAANLAATILTSATISPFDVPKILALFHTRLACLLLLSQPQMAAKEGRVLIDILARETGSATFTSAPASRNQSRERPMTAASVSSAGQERPNPLSLVPWNLRLLLERLKAVMTNDARRGIMNLYALAQECRFQALLATKRADADAYPLWKTRLEDLGIRIAGELLDMGETDTALRHLDTLEKSDTETEPRKTDMATRKTLLYLRLGDIAAAERCLSSISSSSSSSSSTSTDKTSAILTALLHLSQADYQASTALLTDLHAQYPADELITHNLAVSSLYNNDVSHACSLLEELLCLQEDAAEKERQEDKDEQDKKSQPVLFAPLLFNLATIYELRTERAREKKLSLVQHVASLPSPPPSTISATGTGTGTDTTAHVHVYERQTVEFKL